MFKKMDFIIIAVLMLLSFIPTLIFTFVINKNYDSLYAVITIDGKEQQTIQLTGHKGEETLKFETKYGSNIVELHDQEIGIVDADCPDHVCMNPSHIEKPGQSLVCLPNKFMIEIKGKNNDDSDDVILSH